jgi:hypothetical protein
LPHQVHDLARKGGSVLLVEPIVDDHEIIRALLDLQRIDVLELERPAFHLGEAQRRFRSEREAMGQRDGDGKCTGYLGKFCEHRLKWPRLKSGAPLS